MRQRRLDLRTPMKEISVQLGSPMLALILCLFALPLAAKTPHFCLQNFNAYGPIYAPDNELRTRLWTQAFQKSPCAFLNLQEVWLPRHAEQIENALGASAIVVSPNRSSRVGLMGFYQGQLHRSELVFYRTNSNGGALDGVRSWANVAKAFHANLIQWQGQRFWLVNTHLHPTSTEVRLTQILDLAQWRVKNSQDKMLLSGDFNMGIQSLERRLALALLAMRDGAQEALGGAYPEGFCTYCQDNRRAWLSGNHVFDYVFYSNVSIGSQVWSAVGAEVNLRGEGRYTYSDHYGLRVDFQIQARPSKRKQTDIDMRRRELIEVLREARTRLLASTEPEIRVRAQDMNLPLRQIEMRQGPFWDYFLRDR